MLFLSKENSLNSNYNKIREELIPIDNYTKTFPDFRCNLKIKNKIGGFSSYQSEYPFEMIEKNGIIVSQANILLNFNADINKIFFVNIYKQPIKKAFNAFLINKRLEKIISKYVFYTNELNEINVDINKDFFDEDVYLITENYLGIPIFLSEKNGQISFEHTHPMHEFLIHKNRYNDTKKIKNEFAKILKKIFLKNNFIIFLKKEIDPRPYLQETEDNKDFESYSDCFPWRTDSNFITHFRFFNLLGIFYNINRENITIEIQIFSKFNKLLKKLYISEIKENNEFIISKEFLDLEDYGFLIFFTKLKIQMSY